MIASCRRLGIGTKLVQHLEKWCERNGAEYAYMATDCTNEPSINLFTKKCSYAKFRTPTMLVQPVHAHYKPLPSSKTLILPLPPQLAELIYRRIFANSEFFPKDIDQILTNKLNLGTFIALPKKSNFKCNPSNNNNNLLLLPPTFAILSVWNTKDVFKLQLKGASPLTYAWCAGTRALDAYLPWLHFPSIPNVFKQFGVYFLHGLHMEGKHGLRLMKSLCAFAHNMARDDAGCGALVAEVAHRDPVRDGIPHWAKFSWAEDLWCIKKFTPANHHHDDDWVTSRPTSAVIFVDPRDFWPSCNNFSGYNDILCNFFFLSDSKYYIFKFIILWNINYLTIIGHCPSWKEGLWQLNGWCFDSEAHVMHSHFPKFPTQTTPTDVF